MFKSMIFMVLFVNLNADLCAPVTGPTKTYLSEVELAYTTSETKVYATYLKEIPEIEKKIKEQELVFSRNMQKWKIVEAEILMTDKKINHLLENINGVETTRRVK
ncbi:MAG: Unknown protein [uncultured Sulfurovum sp.]|uniref:Uncharacterized protein n=1 Tax=uncultured Sulfurovum sp. TaxID=269237 RepID=A0A6S6SPZ1_9BACT|nr:MAG: Unknown protein [uncultured Sulfurovum sp.]